MLHRNPFQVLSRGGWRVKLLVAQLPQSGFEDFQAGAAPGLFWEAVPISYGLWVVTVLISFVFVCGYVRGTGDNELVFDEWDSHLFVYLVEQD